MSLYFRRSKKVGPFRFTFSNTGVSTSVGPRGVHISKSSRGTYLSMGYAGVRYRERIDKPGTATPQTSQGDTELIGTQNLEQVHDASSEQFLQALREAVKKPQYALPAALVGIVLFAIWASIANPSHKPPNVPLPVQQVVSWVYILAGIGVVWWLRNKDIERRLMNVEYTMSEESAKNIDTMMNQLKTVANSKKIWFITSKTSVTDRKHNAGASSSLNRMVVRTMPNPPKFIRTNVGVLTMQAGRKQVCFFPDRLVIIQGKSVAAVSYPSLNVALSDTRFIESGMGVPNDAQLLEHTWQFVNKNGSPDKRMKNNRQLPVMLYATIQFSSPEGVNELLHVSNQQLASSFVDALKQLTRSVETHLASAEMTEQDTSKQKSAI